MRMTLAEFLDAYNALAGAGRGIGEAEDLPGTPHGILYLPAGGAPGAYVQLAYDADKDRVLFAGAVLDASDAPDFGAFAEIADRVMQVVFPELDAEGRAALLNEAEALCLGALGQDDRAEAEAVSDGRALRYIASQDNDRQLIAYRVGQ